MKVTDTALAGVKIIEPKVFGDHRGFFKETFNAQRYLDMAGIDLTFVQDNHSRSRKGVLRGLHFQKILMLPQTSILPRQLTASMSVLN